VDTSSSSVTGQLSSDHNLCLIVITPVRLEVPMVI